MAYLVTAPLPALPVLKTGLSPRRKCENWVRSAKSGSGRAQSGFRQNPAEFYNCYICGEQLTRKETTLDHIKSRGRHPELRFELSNLAPCCFRDNTEKGSLDLDEYLQLLRKKGNT